MDRSATLAEAQRIMRRYDAANNVAIAKASAPNYDESVWSDVDMGPVLATDHYSTKVAAKSRSKREKGDTYTHTVTGVYGSTTARPDGQDPWLLVTGTTKATGSKAEKYTAALVRTAAGWRMFGDVGVEVAPSIAASDRIPKLTAPQRQTAANAIPAVANALQLNDMSGVSNAKPIQDYLKSLHRDLKGFEIDVSPRPWGSKPGTDTSRAIVVGTPAAHLTRVGSTTLGVIAFDTKLDFDGSAHDATIKLSKPVAAVEKNNGKMTSHLVRRNAVVVVVSIPDKGKPAIIGVVGYYVVP